MSQEFESAKLASCFWLGVSHVVAVKMLARVTVIWGLDRAGRSTLKMAYSLVYAIY